LTFNIFDIIFISIDIQTNGIKTMFKMDLAIINSIIIIGAAGISVSSLLLQFIMERLKLAGLVMV